MKKTEEKIGQLLKYEKLSNIHLLELPQVEKKDIPDYIQCPKYEKAQILLKQKMDRYTTKVDRLTGDLMQMKRNIEDMKVERARWSKKANAYCDTSDVNSVAIQNHAADNSNRLLEKIERAVEKHDDLIDKIAEAKEEAKEKLEELTLEALSAIDEDIPMVINRLEEIISNSVVSNDAEDLLAAIDVCLIALRIHAMFENLIDDNNARKECKDGIAKINQAFSTLCANDSIQNYMVDIYRRNLDLVQKNASISKQIDSVLGSVDQKQLDTLSKSIDVILAEQFETKFEYTCVIDPAEIDKIVDTIKKTIDSLKLNIEKAKAFQAAETSAVKLGKVGVSADQQAKSLKVSMRTNVDTLDYPLTQNHFLVQIIDEVVIEDFYQKDLQLAVTMLRKHIVDTIGEQNFEGILKGGDDRFSLKKAQTAIEKANLTRLQAVIDKIHSHIRELVEKITNAELDIQKANEVPKRNADALSVELGRKYVLACIPVFGFFSAIGIHNRVKTFEPAFRSANPIYEDLGNALFKKNKKMNIVAIIIGAILGFGNLIFFLISGRSIAIPVIVLITIAISVLMLLLTGKKLQDYVGASSDGKS